MNEDFQGLCGEAEAREAHSMNRDFYGGREGILRYAGQAGRSLEAAGTQKDGSKIR